MKSCLLYCFQILDCGVKSVLCNFTLHLEFYISPIIEIYCTPNNHKLFSFLIRLIENSEKYPESEKDHPSFSDSTNASSQDQFVGKKVIVQNLTKTILKTTNSSINVEAYVLNKATVVDINTILNLVYKQAGG